MSSETRKVSAVKFVIESCWNITDGGTTKIFRQGMDERAIKVSFTVSSEICLFHTVCVMILGLFEGSP